MTDPAIIEAAARALCELDHKNPDALVGTVGGNMKPMWTLCAVPAANLLAAVTPLIRAAALEEAAKVAEKWLSHGEMQLRAGEMTAQELRTAKAVAQAIYDGIRALKEQP